MLSAQPMRAPVATQPAKLNPIFQATAPKPVITEDLPGYLPTKGELDPTRVLAFKCAVAMLFTRMSVLPELAATITGVNLYLLYLVAPPAIIGCIMTGGFGRAFERKEVVLWSMFYMIMWIDVPFSSWVGLSFNRAFGYLRTDLICLYIVAGLVLGWSDVQKLYRWLAGSGVLVVLMVLVGHRPGIRLHCAVHVRARGWGRPGPWARRLILVMPVACVVWAAGGRVPCRVRGQR